MTPGIAAISNIVKDFESLGVIGSNLPSEDEEYSDLYYPTQQELDTANSTYDEYSMYDDSGYDMRECAVYNTTHEQMSCLELGYKFYPWSYVFIKPALELALEKIQAAGGLVYGHEIKLQYRDSGGDQGTASSRYSRFLAVYFKRVHVFHSY